MSSDLKDKKCIPCEVASGALNALEIKSHLNKVDDWLLLESQKQIEKDFEFLNFEEALNFVNKVGEIAEDEGHHPDISIYNYNKVKISLSTHSVKGLTENDFIVASKIDSI